MTSKDVRAQLIEALQRDLIGPRTGHAPHAGYAEEALPIARPITCRSPSPDSLTMQATQTTRNICPRSAPVAVIGVACPARTNASSTSRMAPTSLSVGPMLTAYSAWLKKSSSAQTASLLGTSSQGPWAW